MQIGEGVAVGGTPSHQIVDVQHWNKTMKWIILMGILDIHDS